MRRLYFVVLVALGVAVGHSAILKRSIIGPSTVANAASHGNHATGAADVTLTAAGAGIKNCLDQMDVVSAGAYSLAVLDGGTTIYTLTLTANSSIIRDWTSGGDIGLCGSNNTAMYISVTTTSAGAYNINYKGFTY